MIKIPSHGIGPEGCNVVVDGSVGRVGGVPGVETVDGTSPPKNIQGGPK